MDIVQEALTAALVGEGDGEDSGISSVEQAASIPVTAQATTIALPQLEVDSPATNLPSLFLSPSSKLIPDQDKLPTTAFVESQNPGLGQQPTPAESDESSQQSESHPDERQVKEDPDAESNRVTLSNDDPIFGYLHRLPTMARSQSANGQRERRSVSRVASGDGRTAMSGYLSPKSRFTAAVQDCVEVLQQQTRTDSVVPSVSPHPGPVQVNHQSIQGAHPSGVRSPVATPPSCFPMSGVSGADEFKVPALPAKRKNHRRRSFPARLVRSLNPSCRTRRATRPLP